MGLIKERAVQVAITCALVFALVVGAGLIKGIWGYSIKSLFGTTSQTHQGDNQK